MLLGTWTASGGYALTVAAVLFFSKFDDPVGYGHQKFTERNCIRKLMEFSNAIEMYCDGDPFGRTPPSMNPLRNSWEYRRRKDGRYVVYVGTNKVWKSNGDDIVAYGSCYHWGKANVLMLDGRLTKNETGKTTTSPVNIDKS
jgi:prepilin-type processing-associated H-X9-DG protein